MNLLEEINISFNQACEIKQDLSDPECKELCNKLTNISWKIIRNTSDITQEISEDLSKKTLEKTKDFPHLNSRVYEIIWLYRIQRDFLSNSFNPQKTKDLLSKDLEKKNTPTKVNLILQGACEYFYNGIDSAQYYFLRGNQEYIKDSIVTPFLSYSRSVCPTHIENKKNKLLATHEFIPARNKTCILVAANSAYVARFLSNYVNSITSQDPSLSLHLHWIKDSEQFDEKAQDSIDISKNILGEKFSFSEEMSPEIHDKKSYFALRRFLVAPEILKKFQRIIITDIDYIIKKNLSDFLNFNEAFDVSLQISENTIRACFPWLKITAGTVFIKNSAMGRFFLDEYQKRYKKIFLPNGFNWGIDQNILSSIYDDFSIFEFIGNSLNTENPFSVPYEIKSGSK